MSTTHHSQKSNETITVQTLRQRASEMLRTADYLEATEKLTGSQVGATPQSVRGPMSLAMRRKLSKIARARAAKGPTVVKAA